MRRLIWLLVAALACAGDPAREADRPFSAGVARVESIHSEVLVSPPAVARVVVSGQLPDACTELDEVDIRRRGFEIEVTLTTRRSFGARCPPLLRPFRRSINLPIGDYASGLYLVTVNGVQDRIVIHTDPYRRDLLDRYDFP